MEYRFGEYRFEPDERRLSRGGNAVEVSSRYLDALGLMLREPGALVTKDRFMDEVWRGVPVTDEALTQAIRALRKALGDDASNPQFIETIPKHGYRFVAPVDTESPVVGDARLPSKDTDDMRLPLGGALGGALAGALGGVAYGVAGGAALILVMVALTATLGLVAGAGIGAGLLVARKLSGRSAAGDILGGAAGGLIVGALARLLGIDAFTIFVGAAPAAMTGAFEGLLLGAAVGLGVTLAEGRGRFRALTLGAGAGGLAGLLAALMGGRLMAGSLALLGDTFEGRLSLAWFDLFARDDTLARMAQAGISMVEGAAFGAVVTLFLTSLRRSEPAA